VACRLGNALQCANGHLRPASLQSCDVALIGFQPVSELRLRQICRRPRFSSVSNSCGVSVITPVTFGQMISAMGFNVG
jgi:hypothetical protein